MAPMVEVTPATKDTAATYKKTDFRVQIINPILWVTKVKLDPTADVGQLNAIAKVPAKYRYPRKAVRNSTLPSGVMSYSIDNAFTGQLPMRIAYGFVTTEAFNGSYQKNPFNFVHCNLIQTAVYVNGKCYPLIPFTPDYSEADGCGGGNWFREFQNMSDMMGVGYGNAGFDIHRRDFPNGYCIYIYDLTPNRSASDLSHATLIKYGSIRIDCQFSKPLEKTMTCVVFAEYENILKVDKDHNVIVNHSTS